MRNLILLISVLLSSLLLSNCAGGNSYGIAPGSLFTSVTMNKDVSTAADIGVKSGEACSFSILGLIALGDAGAKQAAANGGVKILKAVDYRSASVFSGSIFVSVCTIVRGD